MSKETEKKQAFTVGILVGLLAAPLVRKALRWVKRNQAGVVYIPVTIRAEVAEEATPIPEPERPMPAPTPGKLGGGAMPFPVPAPVPLVPTPLNATLHTVKTGVPHTLSFVTPDTEVYEVYDVEVFRGRLRRDGGWKFNGDPLDARYFVATAAPASQVKGDNNPPIKFTLKKQANLPPNIKPLKQIVFVVTSRTSDKRGFIGLAVEE